MCDNIENALGGIAIAVGQTRITHAAMMRVIIKQAIGLINNFGRRSSGKNAIAVQHNLGSLGFIAHQDQRNAECTAFLLKSAAI